MTGSVEPQIRFFVQMKLVASQYLSGLFSEIFNANHDMTSEADGLLAVVVVFCSLLA